MPVILPYNPLQPIIQTASPLPSATAGVPYTAQITAAGAVPPYTYFIQSDVPNSGNWLSINQTTGQLSGTPVTAETETVTVFAVDSMSTPGPPATFTLTVQAGTVGPGAAVAKIWRGMVQSNQLRIVWWPPTTGPADSYNVYRSDISSTVPYVTGITEQSWPPPFPSTAQTYLWLDDWNGIVRNGVTYSLNPSTAYTYWVTPVVGGIEGPASPPITLTTLAGTGSLTLPTPPTDPSTYVTAPPATYGGTIWTVTQNDTSSLGTAGTGTLGNVGCSFNYAGNNAQPGDTVVLNSGQTYTSTAGGSAFTWNASGTASQPIIVTVSQDPIKTPGGSLIPYTPYASGRSHYTAITLTGLPGVGATSATMTTTWTDRNRYLPVIFATGQASGYEARMCHFVKGSSTITWNNSILTVNNINSIAGGLVFAATDTTAFAYTAGVWVTPDDLATSMATLQFGAGNTQNAGIGLVINGSFVRFIGLYLNPQRGQVAINTAAVGSAICVNAITQNGSHITLDRCGGGNDTTDTGWSVGVRFCQNLGDFLVANQCFIHGFSGGFVGGAGGYNSNGQDSQAFWLQHGGPHCIQNSFLESSSEPIFSGGGYVAEGTQPHDTTVRGNYLHKNGAWSTAGFGDYPKNLGEWKVHERSEFYDNIFQSNWYGNATGGQRGRTFGPGPIDQVAEANQTRNVGSLSWSSTGGGTATLVTSTVTQGAMNFPSALVPIGSIIRIVVSNAIPATYNGTYLATLRSTGGSSGSVSFTYPLPLASDPGPITNPGSNPCRINMVMQGTQPWNHVSDQNVHDNLIYGVASGFYCHQDDGHQPGGYSERYRFANNMVWINPLCIDSHGTRDDGWALQFTPYVPNIIYDHNTIITIPNKTGFLNNGTFAQSGCLEGFSLPPPGTTQQVTCDHFTFTNNVMDGFNDIAVTAGSGHGGFVGTNAAAQSGFFNTATLTWTNNVSIPATAPLPAYPSGVNASLSGNYNAIISAFRGNTLFPTSPQEWNVNVAPYTTFSTTGGPVGAQF